MGRLQSLFPQQFDIIVGSLLGDARLECRSVGARAPITARLRIHHGDKQREYVWWKYEQLKEFVVTPPKQITWVNPKRNLTEVSWYFHTRSIREFGILYQYFFFNKKNFIPTITCGIDYPFPDFSSVGTDMLAKVLPSAPPFASWRTSKSLRGSAIL